MERRCIATDRRAVPRRARRRNRSRRVGGPRAGRRAHRLGGARRAAHAAELGRPHRCELEDGPALALDTARRLCCDATIVGVAQAEHGESLDVGRKRRSISPALARALKARDGGCRFPGGDRTRFTEGHHVHHWVDGGPTNLGNLITLCRFHDRLLDKGGYGLRRTDDGLFVFTRPDGTRLEPNGVQCFRGSISSSLPLREHLSQQEPDLVITAATARCGWHGEIMDYSQAIEAMRFLEDKAMLGPSASQGDRPSGEQRSSA